MTILSQIATEPRHSAGCWHSCRTPASRSARSHMGQVDLDARTITISWQSPSARLPRPRQPRRRLPGPLTVTDPTPCRRVAPGSPKSKTGWRVIPLTPWATAALARWQRWPQTTHGLVWPGRTTSRAWAPEPGQRPRQVARHPEGCRGRPPKREALPRPRIRHSTATCS